MAAQFNDYTQTDILSYMTQREEEDMYSQVYVNDIFDIIINTIVYTDILTRRQYESIMNYLGEFA
jgi:hypothetical protein